LATPDLLLAPGGFGVYVLSRPRNALPVPQRVQSQGFKHPGRWERRLKEAV